MLKSLSAERLQQIHGPSQEVVLYITLIYSVDTRAVLIVLCIRLPESKERNFTKCSFKVCETKTVKLNVRISVVQFNYMHECFERVFCELKWRKEVRTVYFLSHQPSLFKAIFLCPLLISAMCVRAGGGRGHRQGQ